MKTKLLILAAAPLIAFAGGNPAGTSVGFRPLDELGNGTYNNATGGLYSGGSNVIPPAHFAAGQFLAQQIQPRDTNGNPNATGKIGVVCLGMSNSSFIFDTMIELLLGQTATNVVLVNAAVGGFDVADWANPTNSIWGSTVAKVTAKGLTPAQVQVHGALRQRVAAQECAGDVPRLGQRERVAPERDRALERGADARQALRGESELFRRSRRQIRCPASGCDGDCNYQTCDEVSNGSHVRCFPWLVFKAEFDQVSLPLRRQRHPSWSGWRFRNRAMGLILSASARVAKGVKAGRGPHG